MKLEQFLDEERDLLILLLCLSGVKINVPISNDGIRLRISSSELKERDIISISMYAKDLEMVSDRLNNLGFTLTSQVGDRALYERSNDPKAEFEVSDLVQLRTNWGNARVGQICYVYRQESNSISLITEDGNDIGCFMHKNQGKYLMLVKKTNFKYKFETFQKLSNDFDYGVFDQVFSL